MRTPPTVSCPHLSRHANATYVSASDEHNETRRSDFGRFYGPGHAEKRWWKSACAKIDHAKKEVAKLFPVKLEGPADADVTLVGWGSTYNLLYALQRRLEEDGPRPIS